MKRLLLITLFVILVITIVFFLKPFQEKQPPLKDFPKTYWLLLHRKSEREYLYQGVPGHAQKSLLVKTFHVKVGRPGERPTPLPHLVGRDYWIIIEKHPEESPETAPYFLTLDIPAPSESPYGPIPYLECGAVANKQCDWVTPGSFGLHGINGNSEKLSPNDPGSSGCIRHRDADITYLYQLLDLEDSEVRYYIEDK